MNWAQIEKKSAKALREYNSRLCRVTAKDEGARRP